MVGSRRTTLANAYGISITAQLAVVVVVAASAATAQSIVIMYADRPVDDADAAAMTTALAANDVGEAPVADASADGTGSAQIE